MKVEAKNIEKERERACMCVCVCVFWGNKGGDNVTIGSFWENNISLILSHWAFTKQTHAKGQKREKEIRDRGIEREREREKAAGKRL